MRSNDVPAGFTNLKIVSLGKVVEQDKGGFQDQLQDVLTVYRQFQGSISLFDIRLTVCAEEWCQGCVGYVFAIT